MEHRVPQEGKQESTACAMQLWLCVWEGSATGGREGE